MSKTLVEIAKQLKDADKKVQLIYGFNGMGKTRLSREFKRPIASTDSADESASNPSEFSQQKVLYYNAFTEDLFYWDNDLHLDAEPKLRIQPNKFTDWILRRGEDQNIIGNFQRYVNDKLTPTFKEEDIIREGKKTGEKTYREVTFSLDTGTERTGNIKISKGEESNFVWSIFYTLLEEVISIRNDEHDARSDHQFDPLEYVFIDDPVSSLDDNHLIDLAVSLAGLIKSSTFRNSEGLKFIITTHNPLFYNVLWNEFNNDLYLKQPDGSNKRVYKREHSGKYRLDKKADGTFVLKDSNDHPFSYHLFLLSELRTAIDTKQIRKYHFSFLRNILEKTATFLGYKHWENLLEKVDGKPDPFANRILNLSSHSAHAGEESADITDKDKDKLDELIKFLTKTYGFSQEATHA